MAPPKGARSADDHKSEPGAAKEKPTGHPSSSTKMRRGASQTSVAPHGAGKGAVAPPTLTPAQHPAAEVAPPAVRRSRPPRPRAASDMACPLQLNWASFDRDILHAYRREHRLNTPSSFSSTYHQLVLSQPTGIGRFSPTMACRRDARRQTKEQLAMSIRKHFNGMGVQENDVIVDLIHRIHSERVARATGPNRRSGQGLSQAGRG